MNTNFTNNTNIRKKIKDKVCKFFDLKVQSDLRSSAKLFKRMEATVRILNQSGLITRQYTDKKTGEQKVINSVMLKLTDGTDSFLGEITGERAVNCPKFDLQHQYKVQCSMVVREWNSQQTGEAMQATTIYVDKIGMV